jgi:uncharacterized protein YjiK
MDTPSPHPTKPFNGGIRATFVALLVGACGDPQPAPAQHEPGAIVEGSLFAAEPSQQSPLPPALREISGLAVTADGRLFAHDDERAIIHEIDPETGRITMSFGVGGPERGDFEGLAIAPSGAFWLVTSTGQLLRFSAGAPGERVSFEQFDTGLADICEVEGLALLPVTESLILACKQNHRRAMRDTIALYQWRPGADAQIWRSLDARTVAEAAGVDDFRPSAVEVDPVSGRTLILSARDGALVELDGEGALLSARALAPSHAQAEGLTILPNGTLIIADEGAGARALLSVYERNP